MKDEKSDGFKFAVTLIVALGTILYNLYNYFENNPIQADNSFLVNSIIVSFFGIIFLIFYILIKGLSMELKSYKNVKILENLASEIYLITLLFSIISVTGMTSIYIFDRIINTLIINNIIPNILRPIVFSDIFVYFLIFTIILSIFYFIYKLNEDFFDYPLKKAIAISIIIVIFASIVVPFITEKLNGHITINMDNMYNTSDKRIPVSIEITGPNTGLLINLSTINSEYNLNKIDSIKLMIEHNSSRISFGEYLMGNTLEYGKYNIFIDPTNLTEGYYELSASSLYYKSSGLNIEYKIVKSNVKSFYLFKNN